MARVRIVILLISDLLYCKCLRCLVKAHAEGMEESMGNIVKIHSDNRKGNMNLEDAGKESFIHWNRPPVNSGEKLHHSMFGV